MAEQHQTGQPREVAMADKSHGQAAQKSDDDGVQGEGNYAASQRYRDEVKDFLKNADVDKAAHEAAPKTQREGEEMAAAEAEGRSHAKK